MLRRRGRRYPMKSGVLVVCFSGVLLFVVLIDLYSLWTQSVGIDKTEDSSLSLLQLPRNKGRQSVHTSSSSSISASMEIPAWMDTHIKFQNSWIKGGRGESFSVGTEYTLQTNDRKRPPLLIWNCPSAGACGGLGDRLYGIIMGLYIAMLSERIFLIQEWNIDGIPHPLLDYLQPNHLLWHAKLLSREAVDFGLLSTMDNRQHPLLLEPCGLKPDQRDYFLRNNLMTYESQLQQSSCFQDYLKAWSVGQQDIARPLALVGFNTLFHFTEHVDKKAKSLLKKSGTSTDSNGVRTPYIGMHIRTGQGSTWSDPERHSGTTNLERFATCAMDLQKAIAERCGIAPKIYVAADNNEAKEYLLSKHSRDDVFQALTDMEILHIDRSSLDQIANIRNAYDNVWGELKVLIDATCLVMSRSKISTLALDLSVQQPRCAVYFDDCDDEAVRQATGTLSC
jgi:hypothetical protein